MRPNLIGLSEEIVRWGFEVTVHSSKDWQVVFTNPTAGPWKKIMAKNSLGIAGEIHRFEVDGTRPDLVLINDKKSVVLIIEAKTCLNDLSRDIQVHKTLGVFEELTNVLRSKRDNPYWGKRAQYKFELGLLWGSQSSEIDNIEDVVGKFFKYSANSIKDIVCIQGFFQNETLGHKTFWAKNKKNIDFDNFNN
jgi:hypothetical protein